MQLLSVKQFESTNSEGSVQAIYSVVTPPSLRVFCSGSPDKYFASPFHLSTPSQLFPSRQEPHKLHRRRQRTQRQQRWHSSRNEGKVELLWGFRRAWLASRRRRAGRSLRCGQTGWWCRRCRCCTKWSPEYLMVIFSHLVYILVMGTFFVI